MLHATPDQYAATNRLCPQAARDRHPVHRHVGHAMPRNRSLSATMMWVGLPFLSIILLMAGPVTAAPPQGLENLLTEEAGAKAFPLAGETSLADVYVDQADAKVARIAAGLFAEDVQRVTGRKPAVYHQKDALTDRAVLIGTIGRSSLIDRLIREGKLQVADIKDEWETALIQTVDEPLPGIDQALVIVGSDRRATAYGVFELSRHIGVSPWYFWADVPSEQHETLAIRNGRYQLGPPAVKYRGIFLNDEDWGLQPWAAKTFAPQESRLGPKTYKKIYELLLRLRGNYIWPAMHKATVPFNRIPENWEVADNYAIVTGSSHAEPLLRNNIWWDEEERGPWNYATNRDGIVQYWDEILDKRAGHENIYTIGIRGIHDRPMHGPDTVEARVGLLEQVFRDQRRLLKRHIDRPIEQIPQAFVPYKEVLPLYNAGLNVPSDVTLVWPDDNYGYIRRLSSPQEQRRAGGGGVYYHISYLGIPMPYLWLNTTPNALIWEEMRKAYEYDNRRIWILNVGDIKPGEIGTEYFMDLAWYADRFDTADQRAFLLSWAKREFGPTHAQAIADVMDTYFRLGFGRKPELMEQGLFSVLHYGEARDRLASYATIRQRAERIYQSLPDRQKAAFYQLVLYKIRITHEMTRAFVHSDLSDLYAAQQRASTNAHAEQVKQAVRAMRDETRYYNEELSDGKWRHMMELKGIDDWPARWSVDFPDGARYSPQSSASLGVAIEGQARPVGRGDDDDAGINLAARAGRGRGGWALRRDEDIEYIEVPNGRGNAMNPGEGPTISYELPVREAGNYDLYMFLRCPSVEDDSFFVRINQNDWQQWNNIDTKHGWAWKKKGQYQLDQGRHTLHINQREDGTKLSRIRLVPESYPELFLRNDTTSPRDTLPVFSRYRRQARDITVYNKGEGKATWQATTSAPWIELSRTEGSVDTGTRLKVTLDWDSMPHGGELRGAVKIQGQDNAYRVKVEAFNPEEPSREAVEDTFVETNGAVAFEAEHFHRSKPSSSDAAWQAIPGLGRTGSGAVTVQPFTAKSYTRQSHFRQHAPALEYDVWLFNEGSVTLDTYAVPTKRIHEGLKLRYAVAINDQPAKIANLHVDGGEHNPRWQLSVEENTIVGSTEHRIAQPGRHTVKVWMLDPGVVLDKFVLDAGGVRPSYFGPPETKATSDH